MKPIEDLFRNMDRWRHLPAYQLERRADIFFSVYLRSVLGEWLEDELHDTIIPELPVKRDLIWPDRPTASSVKVDYVLFSRDLARSYFVELKTDSSSRREAQDTYLTRCEQIGLGPVVEGIVAILRSTSAHQKYFHLAHTLAALRLIDLPSDYPDFVYPEVRVGLGARLKAIRVPELMTSVRVVYVQPFGAENAIGFDTFASHVERFDDEVSQLFARHLRRWATPAGAQRPVTADEGAA